MFNNTGLFINIWYEDNKNALARKKLTSEVGELNILIQILFKYVLQFYPNFTNQKLELMG